MVQSKSDYSSKSSGTRTNSEEIKKLRDKVPKTGNIEAEALLLGALLKNPKYFYEFGTYLSELDFIEQSHSIIFFSLKSLCESGDDLKITGLKIVAEGQKLGFKNISDLTDNGQSVNSLINQPILDSEVQQYFLSVKKETIKRIYKYELVEAYHYVTETTDTIHDIIGNIEQKILGKAQIIDHGEHALKDLGKDGFVIIEELAKNPGRMGIDLGLPVWQKYVGELRNGSVTFIAGSTKSRKSFFGLHAAIFIAYKHKVPVLLCDSELNQRDQTIRAFGIFYKIPTWVLETGYWKLEDSELIQKDIDKYQLDQIRDAKRKLADEDLKKQFSELPITYLSVNELSVMDAIPLMRQWVFQKAKTSSDAKIPQAFIVYDYLKLSTESELKREGGIRLQEYQSLGLNCAALHNFAQKYNLPILTFGQTNREIDDNINCIAGSKRLVELTDSCSLLKEKSESVRLKFPDGNFMLKVFCSRYGQKTDPGHIDFEFSDTCNISEIGFNDGSDKKEMGQKSNRNSQDDFDSESEEDT